MPLSKMTRQWVRFALDDLKICRAILPLGNSYWRGAAYHSQQCVEKIIKAYLTHHKVRFPKTHNIEELIAAVAAQNREFAQRLTTAKILTKYAIEFRYPDAEKRPMTQKKAEAAVKLAGKIFDIVTEKLRDD